MNELEEARIKINEADSMMAKIFEQRFMAVKKVLEYKKENGMAIFDPVREQEVIARNTALVSEELQPYYKEYLQMLMDISKKYQKDLLKGE
ncbi:MAG: chorismate mutase [Erysipelotrichaceae bacterium]|nr:chorismate mutase [Erysipelotrichaceae bacterium]